MTALTRRRFIAAGGASLAACRDAPAWSGGWVGDAADRGHRLRERDAASAPPDVQRRAVLLIVGAGVAGLAAARSAMQAGIDDIAVFDLHDSPGGNSRGHRLAGVPCPLGAHYLPTPGAAAHEIAEWLHALGIARHEFGRTVYDERHLCHSPQERLFFDSAWHEGLLPPAQGDAATLAQYRRFAALVAKAQRELGFALPSQRAPWTAGHAALDAQTFAQWLGSNGFTDERLRWFLDYCCRDDFGAAASTVSAWAGLHYFASRHGFRAPEGNDDEVERDAVLTWPEGNAWLVQRLAAPLGERLHTGCVVTRVAVQRHGVSIDLWNTAARRSERWSAPQAVMALPLFVAARIVESPPDALTRAAAALRYSPWLVANLHLAHPLLERPGAPPAWDNVRYGSTALGYVNAQHQSLSPVPGATVITAYRSLPIGERAALLDAPWQHHAQQVVNELATLHPDLPRQCVQIDLTRHGHAMSIPLPGIRGLAALRALAEGQSDGSARLHWAHADLAGCSVFEEAFTAGHLAGRASAAALRRQ